MWQSPLEIVPKLRYAAWHISVIDHAACTDSRRCMLDCSCSSFRDPACHRDRPFKTIWLHLSRLPVPGLCQFILAGRDVTSPPNFIAPSRSKLKKQYTEKDRRDCGC